MAHEPAAAHPFDQLCVDTIRSLAIDSVEKANSGHPGAPMGLAPAAYVLWTRHLKHAPTNPEWPDRDRFVLSAGHASALLYSLLYLTGYGLEIEDLRGFRQWGSRTPGHPEHGVTPGVETTTGPLGQGFANAVGMAIAEEVLASRFNRPGHAIVNHHTWGICSDGDMMEGLSHEAASLAGHLKLGKLNFIYDDNHISIDGSTDLAFTDDVAARFDAYGWHTCRVEEGTDLAAIDEALREAKAESERPSLVLVRTHIAQGAPTKQDTAGSHGSPLGRDEVEAWRAAVGWPSEDFHVPAEALELMRGAVDRGRAAEAEWDEMFNAWSDCEPDLATEWDRRMSGRLPALDAALPVIEGEKLATRKATARTLAALASVVPELVGGSADLTESTGSQLGDQTAFAPGVPGRYIHYGVREHAMAAAMNGMALHGGVRPYGGTFLIFSDYMRNSLRLAALTEIPTIFLFSHDSIALGEDGPTHQPIEQLASLRAIPGLRVIRPCDANETVEAWRLALEHRAGPSAIVVTRQDLPILDRHLHAPASGVRRGAYVLREFGTGEVPDVILIGTGSEVPVALAAAEHLGEEGTRVRVVSMPCWEIFESEPQDYRDSVLPPDVDARVSVEAAATFGWERWVGQAGIAVGLNRFGASAPGATVMSELGITPEAVVYAARSLLG